MKVRVPGPGPVTPSPTATTSPAASKPARYGGRGPPRNVPYAIAETAGDPSLTERTWVLLTEAPEGAWGIAGHANTNAELIALARQQLGR